MIINGTITEAGQASEPTGTHRVLYQDVTITDKQGVEWPGRIGSKQGYEEDTPISVTVEVKQGDEGPWNYFRKYNPQYSDNTSGGQGAPSRRQPSTPQRGQQDASQPAGPPQDDKEARIIRGNSLNAIMSATDVPLDMVGDYLVAGEEWIKTGVWSVAHKPATCGEQRVERDGDGVPF